MFYLVCDRCNQTFSCWKLQNTTFSPCKTKNDKQKGEAMRGISISSLDCSCS